MNEDAPDEDSPDDPPPSDGDDPGSTAAPGDGDDHGSTPDPGDGDDHGSTAGNEVGGEGGSAPDDVVRSDDGAPSDGDGDDGGAPSDDDRAAPPNDDDPAAPPNDDDGDAGSRGGDDVDPAGSGGGTAAADGDAEGATPRVDAPDGGASATRGDRSTGRPGSPGTATESDGESSGARVDGAVGAESTPVGELPDGVPAFSFDPLVWLGDLRQRFARSRTLQVVAAITAIALLARLAGLGTRTAHWDEGRVAYWILRYQATGVWEYRPIVHGPFLFHVDKYLFTVFGANDFVARLPVAAVGGLMPATAWLLRDYLRDSEVVALAGLLALNPLLFYYSRFMRNDVLVAGFMLFALGFFARAYATRRPAYVYAGTVSFALAFTAKENALLYVAAWLGALGLLLDHRLIDAVRGEGSTTGDYLHEWAFETHPWRAGAVLAVLAINPLSIAVVADLVGAVPVWLVVAGAAPVVAAAGAYLALANTPYHLAGALAPVPAGIVGLVYGDTTALFAFALAWLLAGALVLDGYLFGSPRGGGTVDWPDDWPRRVPPMAVAYGLLFATLIFFFAPRGGAVGDLGLWWTLLNPLKWPQIPALVEEALLGGWRDLYAVWVAPSTDLEEKLAIYPDNLERYVRAMVAAAGTLSAFAVVGFVLDRWRGDGPRDIVALSSYWGFVSVLGYPYATDIWAPWITVHAIVPLAVPAAVGIGLIVRWGVEAVGQDDAITAVSVAAVLIVLAAVPAATVADVAYYGSDTHERVLSGTDDHNQLVLHWAQPGNDMKEDLSDVAAIASANDDGPDVLFYGTNNPADGAMLFHVNDDDRCLDQPPIHEPIDVCRGSNWHSRLPLPWYLESYGADTTSSAPGNGSAALAEDPPPVVIAYAWDREEVAAELPARYRANQYRFKLWAEDVVFFVDPEAVP